VTARVTTVASLGIFRANARSLVVEEVVAVDTAAADADLWSATTATRRATCPGSAPRVAAADVVAEEEVVAIAITAVNRAICLVTAPSLDKEAAAAAAVAIEAATTADSRVIFPGTVPNQDKEVVVVVVAADATTCNAIVAKDTATCRVNAPIEFQLELHQAFKSAIKGSTFI